LNSEAFQEVVDRFSEEWTTRYPGVHAILFGDQLGVHRRPDIVERALGKGVYLFSLPKNTSHITQPLDEAPFGTFQRLVATGAQQGVIDGMLSNEGTRNALLEAAYTAQRRAFTPGVILGAFRRCGLWPFVPKRMLAQVADALGLGHTDESTRGVAAAAAGDVIQEAAPRAKSAKKRTSTGSAVVERAVLHAPDALLQQSRDIAANKAVEDAVKAARGVIRAYKRAKSAQDASAAAAARVANLCRVCTTRTYRSGKGWGGCLCGTFRVCPGCVKTAPAAAAMGEHGKECPGEVSGGSDSEGSGESEEE